MKDLKRSEAIELNKIGVVGATGMVGGVVLRYFQKEGKEVYGYSRKEPKYQDWVNNEADVIFVCVPTPYVWKESKFDASVVGKALNKIKEGKTVVIKSTVTIGTTDRFQKEYPRLKLLFNPEFLSEATCDADFDHPDRQFVGYTKESYLMATRVLHLLPESPYDLICPAKEAELLKYINNMHGILEVIESNHYYDVCQKEGLNYERVCRAMVASKWVGPSMGRHYRVIYHKGYRGFGGKCFPKDVNAWTDYCKEKGIDVRLLETARNINQDLLTSQGLDEATVEKISSEEDLKKLRKEKK